MNESFNSIAFRDVLLSMILGLVMCIAIIFILMNIKLQDAKNPEPPGNLIVHVIWPTGDIDVDLWVHGPTQTKPVGYSNKGGELWNLLRDDLGSSPDLTPINYEDAFSRGIPNGDYTVNVHCFRCTTAVEVQVEMSMNKTEGGGKGMTVLFTTKVVLEPGKERTAANFRIEGEKIVTIDNVFKPLRAADPPAMQGF